MMLVQMLSLNLGDLTTGRWLCSILTLHRMKGPDVERLYIWQEVDYV